MLAVLVMTRYAAPDTNLFASAVFNSSTNPAIPLSYRCGDKIL